MHDLLGRGLFVRNSAANIDRAIQEGEAAWQILRPLSPEKIPDITLYHLGLYYATKGEMMGGDSTAMGREWFQKAIAILLRARELSVAAGQDFDRLQRAHGKPLADRQGYQPLYKTLGLVYSHLARHAEALEALQAGRSLNPETSEFYSLIAHEYQALGKPDEAAITMIENSEIQGMTPAVVNGMRQLLGPIPEASCAISQQGSVTTLNYNCAWLRANTCRALDDLARVFTDARRGARAAELRRKAVTQFGCPAR